MTEVAIMAIEGVQDQEQKVVVGQDLDRGQIKSVIVDREHVVVIDVIAPRVDLDHDQDVIDLKTVNETHRTIEIAQNQKIDVDRNRKMIHVKDLKSVITWR